jgi:hypothetical protein
MISLSQGGKPPIYLATRAFKLQIDRLLISPWRDVAYVLAPAFGRHLGRQIILAKKSSLNGQPRLFKPTR